MEIYIVSFILSGLLSYLPIGKDTLTKEPQKFHKKPVPRTGGLAIFIATLVGLIIHSLFSWILPVTFSFITGFIEDITRKVSPKTRFLLLSLAAVLAILGLKIIISRLEDIPFMNSLLQFTPFAILFTLIAIVGLANAFNMIDGLNGLASGTALTILSSLMYVSLKVNDNLVNLLSVILFLSILGFFFWNFPWGKIFLGDGGAYFIGFFIACLVITLHKNHLEVSDWYPVAVAVYPIFDALFSIFRRVVLLKENPLKPDKYHLHSLLYFFLRKKVKDNLANPLAAFLLIVFQISFIIPTSLYWYASKYLIINILIFCILYILIYIVLVKKLSMKI